MINKAVVLRKDMMSREIEVGLHVLRIADIEDAEGAVVGVGRLMEEMGEAIEEVARRLDVELHLVAVGLVDVRC